MGLWTWDVTRYEVIEDEKQFKRQYAKATFSNFKPYSQIDGGNNFAVCDTLM